MKFLVLFLSIFTLFNNAHAENCRFYDGTHEGFPLDPYEPSGVMPAGPKAGECVNTENERSYRLLTDSEALKVVTPERRNHYLNPSHHYQFIANISHEVNTPGKTPEKLTDQVGQHGHFGKFWTAAIPVDSPIKDIFFHIEHFPPKWIAAHTQLRFNFKDDSKPILFSQTDLIAEPITLDSLILSVEAVPLRAGPYFDIIKAEENYFVLGTRLVSLPDKVQHMVFDMQDPTEQFDLNFDSVSKQLFWNSTLLFLQDPEMQRMYNTTSKSCTNSLFEAIDHFKKRTRELNNRMFTVMPIWAFRALQLRDLVSSKKKNELPSLNEEFHWPSNKPMIPEKLNHFIGPVLDDDQL